MSDVQNDTLTKTVLIHPVIETDDGELIFSREHTYKDHLGLGDQLARDFIAITATENGILQAFKNDGKENKDYIGWRKNVLAPVSGTVTLVNHPKITNTPGKMNRDAEPGRIFIENNDSTKVILVHVREIKVEEGEQVDAGDVVAKVGNNGISTGPHIHVGAWKDDTPLQIQVDLYAEKRNEKEKKSDSK
ncbi:M23 family metallopeptidase [Fodinibius sp.]|uniref:M23 family metallopeptidase n=1 Tax=Fodinibius sp. TaxID=1872440 RepID=UPI002ACEA97F|nr:M23 family metallopeptidase [Fodinibius sp.]MDZ7658362.1 M23 family metallopeptidase [Fodinibius sp.]